MAKKNGHDSVVVEPLGETDQTSPSDMETKFPNMKFICKWIQLEDVPLPLLDDPHWPHQIFQGRKAPKQHPQ